MKKRTYIQPATRSYEVDTEAVMLTVSGETGNPGVASGYCNDEVDAPAFRSNLWE